MNMNLLPILTLLVAIIGAGCALAAFVRAGRWRDSDDGKAVKEDIHSIKNQLATIGVRLTTAEKADEASAAVRERLSVVERTLQDVASSGDIKTLKAELAGVERIGRNTEAAVSRIENWLMEQPR